MYRTFVDNTIKEFQYNYEEERNRFIVAQFKKSICHTNSSYDDCMIPNFYLAGYNNEHNKYIIRKIPCYFSKALCGEHVGKREPNYDYGTEIDEYYEEYNGCIDYV